MREFDAAGAPPAPRLSTGIHGLDAVLQGGFLSGGSYLLLGRPGAGKTILANQLCMHQTRQGNGAVYVTLLAESHGRLIGNLRRLRFFDESVISQKLHYISGYHVLEGEGFDGLRKLIHQLVKDKDARILVLDGVDVLSRLTDGKETIAFRKFFYELQVLSGLSDTTLFLLSSAVSASNNMLFELADGIVCLRSDLTFARENRLLRVLKNRGSGHLQGNHAYTIGDGGLVVFPRRESMAAATSDAPGPVERLSTGTPAFDRLLGGGVERLSATYLWGAPGTGKTMMGLSFLADGAAHGDKGLYYGFSEPPLRLVKKAEGVGIRLGKAHASGEVTLRWQQPLEVLLDEVAEDLLESARRQGIRRMLIDGLEGLVLSSGPGERLRSFIPVFFSELRALGVTPVLTMLKSNLFSPEFRSPYEELSQFADNIFLLRHVQAGDGLAKEATALKLGSLVNRPRWRRYEITARGIDLTGSEAGGGPA